MRLHAAISDKPIPASTIVPGRSPAAMKSGCAGNAIAVVSLIEERTNGAATVHLLAGPAGIAPVVTWTDSMWGVNVFARN